MYLAVQAVLNSHTTDWKGLPAFATGVEELAELIQNIQSLAQVQTSRSGAAADKAQAFQTLAQSAYEVAAATRQLREFFQRTDTLLKGRLDGLAVQLKNKPDLYNAYRTARRIVDQPGTHATKPPAKTITTSVTLSKAA